MKTRKLNLIAKKVCAWYSSFSLKGFLRLTKKDLDKGKNFE